MGRAKKRLKLNWFAQVWANLAPRAKGLILVNFLINIYFRIFSFQQQCVRYANIYNIGLRVGLGVGLGVGLRVGLRFLGLGFLRVFKGF